MTDSNLSPGAAMDASFDTPQLLALLDALDDTALDQLAFGVIHFNADHTIARYNRYEQVNTGLSRERVIGKNVFTEIAQCMNNFMVAEKFAECARDHLALDETIDYVLTWKMKPTPVKLRMLQGPAANHAYVVLLRV